ncbi:hypothetical protein J6590_003454 [Homalodisca vitripennis]|nr:hypothetical protein J6590_003454 [Homalodisca vitripennis]
MVCPTGKSTPVNLVSWCRRNGGTQNYRCLLITTFFETIQADRKRVLNNSRFRRRLRPTIRSAASTNGDLRYWLCN